MFNATSVALRGGVMLLLMSTALACSDNGGDTNDTPAPCGGGCSLGFVCNAETNMCEPVGNDCDLACPPPEAACQGNVATTFTGDGTVTPQCACDFDPVTVETDCAADGLVCEDGACVSPCDTDCTELPEAFCDDDVLVTYDGEGACDPESAQCDFSAAETRTDCQDDDRVCRDGACIDLCQDVDCTAPAPRCDDNTAVTTDGDGTCDPDSGTCDFGENETRTDCDDTDQVCVDGACIDGCQPGQCTQPEDFCDGTTAVAYAGDGTCDPDSRQCDFGDNETRTDCAAQDQACIEGACIDLCGDVDCTTPEAFCQNDVAVSYDGEGACNIQNGQCNFDEIEVRQNCADEGLLCIEGACVDLCEGVDCSQPDDTCEGGLARRYNGDGVCDPETGQCDFDDVEEIDDCGFIGLACVDAACVDLCVEQEITCAPLPDACDGNVQVVYNGDGDCNGATGECNYDDVELRVDCADRGQVCQQGACVSLDQVTPGDLIITEIMQNPRAADDGDGEYIELFNRTDRTLLLNGLQFTDGAQETFILDAQDRIELQPGQFFVLARSLDPELNGGFEPDALLEAFNLGNLADTIIILNDANAEITRIEYDDGDTFPDPNGASMQFGAEFGFEDPVNNDGTLWCESRQPISGVGSDFGTPGAPNDDCEQDPLIVTLYAISDIDNPDHPPVRTLVQVDNVAITAISPDGIFVQEIESGPFSAAFVEPAGADLEGLNIGDRVNLTGIYDERFDQAHITLDTIERQGPGQPPAPEVLDTFTLALVADAEPWESVLVQINDLAVTDTNPDAPQDFGEFAVDDGVRIDDLYFAIDPDPIIGTTFEAIIGPLNFSFGNFKIEPRSAADVIGQVQFDLCRNVECPAPEPECQGDLAVTFIGDGVCINGACNFAEVTTARDCRLEGLTCQGGQCVGDAVAPSPGDIVITEIMQNPRNVNDNVGEYFEITNRTFSLLSLAGLTFTDNNNDSFTIPQDSPLTLSPQQFLVLGINADTDTNGGVEVDFEYSGMTLANSDDAIVILAPGDIEIARIEYDDGDTFPDPTGASMQFGAEFGFEDPINNNGTLWCESRQPIGEPGSDLGTPGAPNDDCEQVAIDVDIFDLSNEDAPEHPDPGTLVRLTEVVVNATTADGRNFFVQESLGGPFSGIAVSNPDLDLPELITEGLVTIEGIYEENFGLARIRLTNFTALGPGIAPLPELLTTEILGDPELAEPWESTLVQISDLTVTDANPDEPQDFGEFVVNDNLRVDDLIFTITPDPELGTTFDVIIGVLNFSFGNFKLEPRSVLDVAGQQPPQSCDFVDCTAPPADCIGDVAVTYSGDGVCDEETFECDFSQVQQFEDCRLNNQTCVAGVCQ